MVDVGTVDVEEFAGSHIICVDHREVRDPIWREDGLISREELVAHLHHELHVERDGDWPPGPRALQLLHVRFPGRCGVEKVVGSAGLVWEAARDEAKLDDGVEGSLITGVIHHSWGTCATQASLPASRRKRGEQMGRQPWSRRSSHRK